MALKKISRYKSLFIINDVVIIRWMIRFYCRKKHGGVIICEECSGLLEYAEKRIEKCPYGKNKPVCSNCTIHCYNKEKRERIKEVMRFSGPAIIFRKPVTGIKYLLKKKFYKPEN